MKNEIKDGADMKLVLKIVTWVTCGLLYFCQISPIYFRLKNDVAVDTVTIVGTIIMAVGIIIESVSDYTKNKYKNQNPNRFCDVGLFKIVRCPNYFGEVLIWTGVLVSGITALNGVVEWVAALIGWVCIVYIMLGGARRLEIRQNKNYGDNPEYHKYVKKTPILLPLIPLYSLEKCKWLVC